MRLTQKDQDSQRTYTNKKTFLYGNVFLLYFLVISYPKSPAFFNTAMPSPTLKPLWYTSIL
jgi:hypothetical protein